MNVDTGQFAAIQERADAVDELRADMDTLTRAVRDFAAAVALAERPAPAASSARAGGGRHAAPRRERPAYLRLVRGGGQ